jgi:hypothetical protein
MYVSYISIFCNNDDYYIIIIILHFQGYKQFFHSHIVKHVSMNHI